MTRKKKLRLNIRISNGNKKIIVKKIKYIFVVLKKKKKKKKIRKRARRAVSYNARTKRRLFARISQCPTLHKHIDIYIYMHVFA